MWQARLIAVTCTLSYSIFNWRNYCDGRGSRSPRFPPLGFQTGPWIPNIPEGSRCSCGGCGGSYGWAQPSSPIRQEATSSMGSAGAAAGAEGSSSGIYTAIDLVNAKRRQPKTILKSNISEEQFLWKDRSPQPMCASAYRFILDTFETTSQPT